MSSHGPNLINKTNFSNSLSFYIIIFLFIFVLFFNFFSNGYVMNANHDRKEMNLPYDIFNLRSVHNGKIPQWNPYIFCGISHFGNSANIFFYPPMMLAYLLPEHFLPMSLTILMMFHIFFAGLFSWWFFREIFGRNDISILCSIIYTFSSSSIMNVTVGIECFVFWVYLPLWLYLIETFNKRSYFSSFFFTSITLIFLLTGGMFQRVMYTVWFCFLYIIFKSFSKKNNKIKFNFSLIILNSLAFMFALAISSIRIIPFVYDTINHGLIGSSSYSSMLSYAKVCGASFIRFFAPEFLGIKLHSSVLYTTQNSNHLEAFSCYAGTIPAILSLYTLFFIWEKRTFFWKTAVLLIMLILLNTPLTYIQYLLSGKSQLLYGRIAWFIPICTSVLFGFAFQHISVSYKKYKSILMFSVLTTFFVFLIMILMYNIYNPIISKSVFASIYISISVLYFIVISFSLIIILILLKKIPNKKIIFLNIIFVIVALDLIIIAIVDSNNSNPFLTPRPLMNYSENEYTAAKYFNKNNRLYRILCKSFNTTLNQCIPLGIYSPAGADSNAPDLLTKLYCYHDKEFNRGKLSRSFPDNKILFDITSTGKIILNAGEVIISHPLPRTVLFDKYTVIPDDSIAADYIYNPQFNPFKEVILNEKPNITLPAADKAFTFTKPVIIKEDNEYVQILTNNASNSILLLNDSYYEGWKAFIDGLPIKILRGNLTFRAVEVPKGQHKIEFYFEHPVFKISILITLISFFLFISSTLVIIFIKKSKY